eukprot:1428464-Pleurochrysis_carterae.AAC.1
MAMVTGNDASESARDAFVQLQGSTSEALTKLRALERLRTSHRAKVVQADGDGADRDVDASLTESESADAEQSLQQAMETLSVFEACLSHRILNPPKPKAVVAEALTVVVGEATGMMQPGQPGVSEIDEEQMADMRAQIAELKKQNEQLMTVVTCQATSIAQANCASARPRVSMITAITWELLLLYVPGVPHCVNDSLRACRALRELLSTCACVSLGSCGIADALGPDALELARAEHVRDLRPLTASP